MRLIQSVSEETKKEKSNVNITFSSLVPLISYIIKYSQNQKERH